LSPPHPVEGRPRLSRRATRVEAYPLLPDHVLQHESAVPERGLLSLLHSRHRRHPRRPHGARPRRRAAPPRPADPLLWRVRLPPLTSHGRDGRLPTLIAHRERLAIKKPPRRHAARQERQYFLFQTPQHGVCATSATRYVQPKILLASAGGCMA